MMPTTNTNQYQRILTAHERAMHRRQADKDRIGRLLGPQDQHANTLEITTQRLASAKLDVDMPLKYILRILSTFNPKGNTLKVKIPIRTMLISFTLTKAIFEDGIPLIKTEKENYNNSPVGDTYHDIAKVLDGDAEEVTSFDLMLKMLNQPLGDQVEVRLEGAKLNALVKLMAITQISEEARNPGMAKILRSVFRAAVLEGTSIECFIGAIGIDQKGGRRNGAEFITGLRDSEFTYGLNEHMSDASDDEN